MPAGTEFAFWLLLFALIGIACAVHWLVTTVMKLKAAQREIARLRAEVKRCRAWLHPDRSRSEAGAGRVRYPKDLVIGR